MKQQQIVLFLLDFPVLMKTSAMRSIEIDKVAYHPVKTGNIRSYYAISYACLMNGFIGIRKKKWKLINCTKCWALAHIFFGCKRNCRWWARRRWFTNRHGFYISITHIAFDHEKCFCERSTSSSSHLKPFRRFEWTEQQQIPPSSANRNEPSKEACTKSTQIFNKQTWRAGWLPACLLSYTHSYICYYTYATR